MLSNVNLVDIRCVEKDGLTMLAIHFLPFAGRSNILFSDRQWRLLLLLFGNLVSFVDLSNDTRTKRIVVRVLLFLVSK